MKHPILLKSFQGLLTLRSGFTLLLFFLVCQRQALATCTANASFTYKDSGGVVYFTNLSTGFNQCIWYFGDGQVSYASSPIHAYNFKKDSTYVCIRLSVWDTLQSNCKDTLLMCVFIRGCRSNASFTYRDSAGTMIFTNNSTGSGKYLWNFGDGNTSVVKSPKHIYSYSKSRAVCVTLKAFDTSMHCNDTAIRCFYTPGCSANAIFTISRLGNTVMFINNGNPALKYKWTFGDGSHSSQQNPTHTFSMGIYSIKLVVIDSVYNCMDSFTTGMKFCNAWAGFSKSVFGYQATFTNTSIGGYNYQWFFGDGDTSSATNPVHTYSSTGSYPVKLMMTDSLNICRDSMLMYVNITGCMIAADFTVKDSAGLQYFTNNSVGTNNSYYWNFGDGFTSTDTNPVHSFPITNAYRVALYVSDTVTNCFDSFATVIYVKKCRVYADFWYKDSNTLHYFYNYWGFGNKHEWFFGDSTNSSTMDPSHKYSGASRSITVTHIVTDTIGNCSDTSVQVINYSSCDAYFTIEPDTNNSYSAIIVERSRASNKTTASYLWYFGDGDSSLSRTPTHMYSGSGKYTLCLNIYDSGCISNYCRELEFDSAGNMISLGTPFSIRVIAEGQPNTSVNLVDYMAGLKVYPNPASSLLNIESRSKLIKRVGLVDIQGRTIMTQPVLGNALSLDIGHLPEGLYIIYIQYDNDEAVRVKFIKN
jgi:PKD repeat protein